MHSPPAVVLLLAALGLSACSHTTYQAHFVAPSKVGTMPPDAWSAPFLKCHMKNGDVVVLDRWTIDDAAGYASGHGVRYDMDRLQVGAAGPQAVRLADVALFETNRPYEVQRGAEQVAALAVGTGLSLALTAYCLSNTKACFGSCPTFFADDGHGMVLQAEGFSSSIARSLEATDVDAMWTAAPKGRDLKVVMTNDALETHVVDSVRVLAARRPPGGRVLRAGDVYYPATNMAPPSRVVAESGDVTAKLRATDGDEYKSPASPTDLAQKETLEVRFPARGGRVGVLVVGRNSLLNTFLFYQGLAFMGHHVADWMTLLERRGRAAFAGLGSILGDVEVSVRTTSGAFVRAGSFAEVGPIAREAQLVVLPDDASREGGELQIRLTMTRGNWRLDQLALASLGDPVTPVALSPRVVLHKGEPDPRAKAELMPGGAHLTTMPGDAYTLHFDLPAGESELFLESRGYYYEWMREEWLRDEDQTAATQLVFNPAAAMKTLAPRFKAIEPDMDRVFWQSRVKRW